MTESDNLGIASGYQSEVDAEDVNEPFIHLPRVIRHPRPQQKPTTRKTNSRRRLNTSPDRTRRGQTSSHPTETVATSCELEKPTEKLQTERLAFSASDEIPLSSLVQT